MSPKKVSRTSAGTSGAFFDHDHMEASRIRLTPEPTCKRFKISVRVRARTFNSDPSVSAFVSRQPGATPVPSPVLDRQCPPLVIAPPAADLKVPGRVTLTSKSHSSHEPDRTHVVR